LISRKKKQMRFEGEIWLEEGIEDDKRIK